MVDFNTKNVNIRTRTLGVGTSAGVRKSNGWVGASRTSQASAAMSMRGSIFNMNRARGASGTTTTSSSTTTTTSSSSSSSNTLANILTYATLGTQALGSIADVAGAFKSGGSKSPTTNTSTTTTTTPSTTTAGGGGSNVSLSTSNYKPNIQSSISSMQNATTSADLSSAITSAKNQMAGISGYSQKLQGDLKNFKETESKIKESFNQCETAKNDAEKALTAQQGLVDDYRAKEKDAIENLKNSEDITDQAYGDWKENEQNVRISGQKLDKAKANTQKADDRKNTAKQNVDNIKKSVSSCELSIKGLKAELANLKAQLPSDTSLTRYANLQAQINAQEAKIAKEEAKLADLKAQQQQAEAELEQAEQGLQTAKADEATVQQEYEELSEETSKLEAEYKTRCKEQKELERNATALQQAYDKAEIDSKEAEKTLQDKQQAYDTAEDNFEKAQTEQDEYNATKDKIAQLNASKETLKSDIQKQESRLNDLQKMEKKYGATGLTAEQKKNAETELVNNVGTPGQSSASKTPLENKLALGTAANNNINTLSNTNAEVWTENTNEVIGTADQFSTSGYIRNSDGSFTDPRTGVTMIKYGADNRWINTCTSGNYIGHGGGSANNVYNANIDIGIRYPEVAAAKNRYQTQQYISDPSKNADGTYQFKWKK